MTLGARRRINGHGHGLHVDHHFLPAQQVETEPARDGEEPGQEGALGVEPVEVHERPDERLLGKVLGLRAPKHAPAETIHRALEAEHELAEGRRITAAGPSRKVELRVRVARIPPLGRHHAPSL